MKKFVICFIVLLASPTASFAQLAACVDDAKKFCGSVINDREARRACMKSHAAQLSAGCREAQRRADQGKGDLETCRKLAYDKYYIEAGRALNNAVGPAIARCMKGGPPAL